MTKRKIVNIITKFGNFDCVFYPNTPEKGYTVLVPKLKGVVTFGTTLIEAKKMVQEAIELHCECLLSEGLAELRIYRKPKSKISSHASV